MKSQEFLNSNFDFSQIVKTYTRHLKWFVISIIFALACAFLFIRYTAPQYAVKAKIHILEDKNSGSELSAFSDLGLLGAGKNNVEDEIEIFNSRSNFIEVVKKLKLNLIFTSLGNIKDSEIYGKRPFNVSFLEKDSIINNSKLDFYIDLDSESSFGYSVDSVDIVKKYSYGKSITTSVGDIVITPNLNYIKRFKGQRVKVSLRPIFLVAEGYQKRVEVSTAKEFSNIINVFLNTIVKQKGIDILNELIYVYNDNAIEDKRIIADKTSNFIDERINEISTSLTSVDQTAEEFKTQKGVTDIASESNIALNVGAANRQQLENARTQMNIAAGMNSYLSDEKGYDPLPSNVGLADPTIAGTTAKYNELVLERKRLLKSADEQNPMIVNLDQQLNGLKSTIKSSLSGVERNLGMQVNNLSSQMARINSKIYSAPKNARELRDITRQQETTESLYLYLLQKREESQITLASSSPKSKIIDNAHLVQLDPISPKKPLILVASLLIGFLLPFTIIYVTDLLDTKVHNKHSLESISKDIPVLGELPSLGKKDQKLIAKDDRSVMAEALRILRTNLDYLIKTKKGVNGQSSNKIFITSSVSGEGKTFISTNLSMILASTDKKVLLIGADIRNPKFYSFFVGNTVDKMKRSERNKDAGLTEYLVNKDITVKDIINPMLVHNNTIDVIYSGKIPPNPAELLMSDRIKELLDHVSNDYDYVIVDTAPLMVVSDTLLISEHANHIIYVTRAGVTEKNAVNFPIGLLEEGKIKNVSFVVNDVRIDNLGYGGKYGYGYGESDKQPWWKF